jgi:AcrR family transcriptional regulator
MTTVRERSDERPIGPGRARLHEAALRLFAEHGVSGTSLQMIADEVGVTKAAVYYHYKTKDELVLGVVTPFVERIFGFLEEGKAKRGRRVQQEFVLRGLVDLIVEARHLYVVTANDPIVVHLHEHHPRLRLVADEMREMFVGPEPDDEREVAVVFFLAGLTGPLADPACRRIDDDVLRGMLMDLGRRFLLQRKTSRG